MKIDIVTLFPTMFDGFINNSIIKRAISKGNVNINIINLRDYSPYPNKQVDDYSYGGGGGMVLMCEPIFNCIEDLKGKDSLVIMTTPMGCQYTQEVARNLKEHSHLIILCGHYEGFDERIKTIVDKEISVGPYILTGGEIPSMIITDSVVRLLDGVISSSSLVSETFNDNLSDYPVYTKPAIFRGLKVPDVLISGNHKKIAEYRNSQKKVIDK
ncbi:MAG: tRNA (guanosine(37)-N1)-methyltransferase TrmD [bacterium]|nr:tRNA (guanosine(37)-N1)-methyltransferase TrmD [bacterium]